MSLNLCANVGANTGAIDCDVKRGRPVTIGISGATFTTTQTATPTAFKAAIKTACKIATGASGKFFGLPENVGITNKTDAPKEGILGTYGPKVYLIEGKPAYEFDLPVGIQLEKKLRAFNGKQVPVFIFDDQKYWWGRVDSAGNFAGYTAVLFCIPKPFEDANTPQVTKFLVSLVNASEFGDSGAYVPATNMAVADVAGLKDVNLSFQAPQTTNVGKIFVKIATSQHGVDLNIYDDYSALLVVGMWVATNAQTGAAFTITSVAVDAVNKCFTFTLDTTAFTALTSGQAVNVNLAAPSVLDAANITGIESVTPIQFIKP